MLSLSVIYLIDQNVTQNSYRAEPITALIAIKNDWILLQCRNFSGVDFTPSSVGCPIKIITFFIIYVLFIQLWIQGLIIALEANRYYFHLLVDDKPIRYGFLMKGG